MTTTLERAEQLAAAGHMFFFGKSAVPGGSRFATIRFGAGETTATGKGQTCEEALLDAMNNMHAPKLDMTSEPQLPPLTKTSATGKTTDLVKTMPGVTVARKMPGM